MEIQKDIIDSQKQLKLKRSLPKYLKSKEKALIKYFGQEKTDKAMSVAQEVYPEIVCAIPFFNTPMYDALIVLASKMAALKKGLKTSGISTEEFVKFNIETTRETAGKVPVVLKRLGGKIYLSKAMRRYLSKVAKSVTQNGWPTKLINGKKDDDFEMSLETRNCQMVAFWESIGEGDIRSYCTFFDFTSAEILGIGLKQVSTIDSGMCKYCFYKKGKVEWPQEIQSIMMN